MGIFGLGNRKKVTWNSLSKEKQTEFSRQIIKHINALARYKVCQGWDQNQREKGTAERKNEDQILDVHARLRLLDTVRNQVRNSSTTNTIIKQLLENVVGTKGGKATIDFPFDDNEDIANELRKKFSSYTRSVDFFQGLSLNDCLRVMLIEELCGGDYVVLFDKDQIEGSGKILIYESDEIVNTSEDAIRRHYGKYATQSNGKVYNRNGRWIGTVVSRSERGNPQAAEESCYFLKRNPDDDVLNSMWIQPSNIWRSGQGRGISPFASTVGAIQDLEDLTNFELQKAKKSSQTYAQIIQTKSSDDTQLPSVFGSDVDFSTMTDQQIEDAIKAESQGQEQSVSLQQAKSCGVLFDQMPDGYKMEFLNSNSPNESVIDFVKWICGRSASGLGLSEVFATLMPDSTSFRAQQLLTAPTFEYYKKRLEKVLDWLIVRFVDYIDFKGEFDKSKLPENWLRYISWQFPKLDELDEVQYQTAIQMKLKNMTSNYREILGNDWKAKLKQVAVEIEWLKKNHLPVPQYDLISGGQGEGANLTTEVIEEIKQ